MTHVSFDIPISNDNLLEGNEMFVLIITQFLPSINGSISYPSQATVTIVYDDGKHIGKLYRSGKSYSQFISAVY